MITDEDFAVVADIKDPQLAFATLESRFRKAVEANMENSQSNEAYMLVRQFDFAGLCSAIDMPVGTPMDGRVIYHYQIQSLEGRILTFIESLGLRESQEKSAKDIFRDIFYREMYFNTVEVWGEQLNAALVASSARGPVGVHSSN
jgi:hypothetical protein